MKILQIIQRDQRRGAEIFACQLSLHLTKLGHDVMVIALFDGDGDLNQLFPVQSIHRLKSSRFFDFQAWKQISAIITSFDPDIVQSNAADTLKYAFFSKLFFRWSAPIVYRNANLISGFAASKISRFWNSWLLGKTDHIISVSNRCQDDLQINFNIPKSKSSVIEIGINASASSELPDDLKEVFSNGPGLIHVGSFVPEKNHTGLIRIFTQLHQEFPNLKLVLVGTGQLVDSIKQLVRSQGLSSAVTFAGVRLDVFPLLRNSKAFVLPSLVEGIPAVLLEAMYCKCPVFAYDAGGIPDLISSGENGTLIPVGHEKEMIQALRDYFSNSNSDYFYSMTSNAHETVNHNFLNPEIAKRFQICYQSIIALASNKIQYFKMIIF